MVFEKPYNEIGKSVGTLKKLNENEFPLSTVKFPDYRIRECMVWG